VLAKWLARFDIGDKALSSNCTLFSYQKQGRPADNPAQPLYLDQICVMDDEIVKGSCHCGAVQFTYVGRPKALVVCNCSICRRLRPLLAHGTSENITIHAAADATMDYTQGDRTLAWQTCRECGCTTHYVSLGDESPGRMAVNFEMADPKDIAHLPLRHFDGADSWRFVD